MVKTLILSTGLLCGMGPLNPVSAQQSKGPNPLPKAEVKFLEDISIALAPTTVSISSVAQQAKPAASFAYNNLSPFEATIEQATELQLKFAILLDTEVEGVAINQLYQGINDWWGTRYQYGGTSRDGIDCSAFMQVLFSSQGVSLPRTAKEQHDATQRINREALVEGDLVFFNTRGGVSHVGVYLQNNKFAHAATSGGVMISDLDEAYWAKRYISAGRYQNLDASLITLLH